MIRQILLMYQRLLRNGWEVEQKFIEYANQFDNSRLPLNTK